MEALFEELRSNEKRDAEELEKARKRFQAVSSGLYSGGDEGDAASLQQQIMGMHFFFVYQKVIIWKTKIISTFFYEHFVQVLMSHLSSYET